MLYGVMLGHAQVRASPILIVSFRAADCRATILYTGLHFTEHHDRVSKRVRSDSWLCRSYKTTEALPTGHRVINPKPAIMLAILRLGDNNQDRRHHAVDRHGQQQRRQDSAQLVPCQLHLSVCVSALQLWVHAYSGVSMFLEMFICRYTSARQNPTNYLKKGGGSLSLMHQLHAITSKPQLPVAVGSALRGQRSSNLFRLSYRRGDLPFFIGKRGVTECKIVWLVNAPKDCSAWKVKLPSLEGQGCASHYL